MSVRLGERWIKLSTTKALNSIRKNEELEKGWRKNEIGLPEEFRDLDPVHVVPLKTVDDLIQLFFLCLLLSSTNERSILVD